AGHGSSGRITGKDAFFAGQVACHQRCVFIGYFLEVVNDVKIYIFWEEILTNALGNVRVYLALIEDARLFVLLEYRPVRVDTPHDNIGIFFLEVPAGAADGAPGTHTRYQMRNFPFGLLPY